MAKILFIVLGVLVYLYLTVWFFNHGCVFISLVMLVSAVAFVAYKIDKLDVLRDFFN